MAFRNKKGDVRTDFLNEVMKFVLGALILLLTIGILAKLAYNLFGGKVKDPNEKSLEILRDEINSLRDGETRDVPLYIGEGYLILGFMEGQDEAKGKCSEKILGDLLYLDEPYKKNARECGDKACLCLYRIIAVKGSQVNYIPDNEPLVKCLTLDYSAKGSEFSLAKGRIDLNVYQWLLDWLNQKETLEISCEMAIVPQFDGVGFAKLRRDRNTVYICWGDECGIVSSCSNFGLEECLENRDSCYPTYKNGGTSYKGCNSCEKDFECSMIGSICAYSDCREGCNADPCGKDCFYRPAGAVYASIGSCYDSSELEEWERFLTLEDCIAKKYYPEYTGVYFSNCKECPQSLECTDIGPGIVNQMPEQDAEKVCNADICGLDCVYRAGSCIAE